MHRLYKNILCFLMVGLVSGSVFAQVQTPADTESAMVVDAIKQTSGDFDQVDLGYIHSLGMQQKAWNNPMEHLGEGQTKPGYTKYNWTPDTVLPVRLREGMMTLINFPAWELIEKVHIGSPESFGGEIVSSNSLLLYADPNYIGVDSNMIVFGRSGNRYVFYLRSEGFNTDKITQSVVDILVGPRWTPASSGGQMGEAIGVTSSAASPLTGGTTNASVPTTAGGMPQDWMKTIQMDPESIKFDLDMFIPNPDDVDIAPDNVWRDNIFTYIDLGPKALTMTQRPIVSLLLQDSEVPVGYRTRGPNGRLIVVEAIGDLVLRNGRKLICIKMRRDPAAGLEFTNYASPDVGMNSVSQQAVMTEDGSIMGQGSWTQAPAIWTQTNYQPSATVVQPYCHDETGADRCQNNSDFATIKSIPDSIMKANKDVVAAASKNEIVPVLGTESIAVEFGTSPKITELETLWNKVYSKNKDILSGYEPYYSVDATADGDVLELFRLRAGMLKDVSTAEALCRKMGKRGYSCSVVKIQ